MRGLRSPVATPPHPANMGAVGVAIWVLLRGGRGCLGPRRKPRSLASTIAPVRTGLAVHDLEVFLEIAEYVIRLSEHLVHLLTWGHFVRLQEPRSIRFPARRALFNSDASNVRMALPHSDEEHVLDFGDPTRRLAHSSTPALTERHSIPPPKASLLAASLPPLLISKRTIRRMSGGSRQSALNKAPASTSDAKPRNGMHVRAVPWRAGRPACSVLAASGPVPPAPGRPCRSVTRRRHFILVGPLLIGFRSRSGLLEGKDSSLFPKQSIRHEMSNHGKI